MIDLALKRCQERYDNMTPPDEYCKECGREVMCDCICEDDSGIEDDCD